jgi:hypothetical protein
MDWKKHLPTLNAWLERRRVARLNQLPKHLQPVSIRPILLQLVLNTAIIVTFSILMLNKDEYVSNAGPAMGLVICLLFLFYTVPSSYRLHRRHKGVRGQRLAKLNIWLAGIAFLFLPISIAVFLE